ncbi:hypothetical protein JAAARDRAFT_48416 [Jaapia argillacea MUCL 33604]|uniref:F-box domain-containing protein n=1 Tax=Jaapia argillacea MUCL 33604 TaxID=933084 RepID=A0A067PXM6_9AGAM|nr:hypothetical protein JAAARDRAFT_48416 [Jaapia argillacea MUCL 33604]
MHDDLPQASPIHLVIARTHEMEETYQSLCDEERRHKANVERLKGLLAEAELFLKVTLIGKAKYAPVYKLPTEILSMFLKAGCTYPSFGFVEGDVHDFRSTFSLISRRFRDVAFQTSWAWSSINLRFGRSAALPLWITLAIPSGDRFSDMEAITVLLQRNIHRLLDHYRPLPIFDALHEVTAPCLQLLRIDGDSMTTFSNQMPLFRGEYSRRTISPIFAHPFSLVPRGTIPEGPLNEEQLSTAAIERLDLELADNTEVPRHLLHCLRVGQDSRQDDSVLWPHLQSLRLSVPDSSLPLLEISSMLNSRIASGHPIPEFFVGNKRFVGESD